MGCCFTAVAGRIPAGGVSTVKSSYNHSSSFSVAASSKDSLPIEGSGVVGRKGCRTGSSGSSGAVSDDILIGVPGNTVHVPGDYATLKEALSHAPAFAGETLIVRISGGTFDAAVIHVPNIRVEGAGPNKTKLVGSLVVMGGVKGCFVSGLSIMCSRGSGVDISGHGSQLELYNCHVTDCDGSGVVAGEGSECNLKGCVVEKNMAHGITGHGANTRIVIADTEVKHNHIHGICAEQGCTIRVRKGVRVRCNGNFGMFASFDQSLIEVLRQQGGVAADESNKAGASGTELGGIVDLDLDTP